MRQIRLRHSLEDFSRIGSDCGQRSDHFVVRPTVSVTVAIISLLIITMTSCTNKELGEVPHLHWNVNDVFGHEYRAHADRELRRVWRVTDSAASSVRPYQINFMFHGLLRSET